MKSILVMAAVSITLLLASVGGDAVEDQTLHYVESDTALELTIPAGGVWLFIPLDGFERIRPVTSGAPGPRSFNVVNREEQVEIFGAFDSASVYPGFRRNWAEAQEAMELEGAPQPQNVKLTREGDWDVIVYDTQRGGRQMSHVVGELIKDQVWIDVQVRATGAEDFAALRKRALEAFRSLSVRMN